MAVDFIGVNCHELPLTHVAALCHVWSESCMWNGRDPDEEISFNGAAFGGIEDWRDGIVTRGVLLDVPKCRGQPFVTFEQPWDIMDLTPYGLAMRPSAWPRQDSEAAMTTRSTRQPSSTKASS